MRFLSELALCISVGVFLAAAVFYVTEELTQYSKNVAAREASTLPDDVGVKPWNGIDITREVESEKAKLLR